MKVHILGSRRAFRASAYDNLKTREAIDEQMKRDSGWLGIDLDMDDLPAPGERITLDGGSAYVITDRHWFVSTEVRNTPDWDIYGDVRSPGEVETVHLMVEPEGYEARNHPQERFAAGRNEIREEVRKIMERNPDPATALAIISYYLQESET